MPSASSLVSQSFQWKNIFKSHQTTTTLRYIIQNTRQLIHTHVGIQLDCYPYALLVCNVFLYFTINCTVDGFSTPLPGDCMMKNIKRQILAFLCFIYCHRLFFNKFEARLAWSVTLEFFCRKSLNIQTAINQSNVLTYKRKEKKLYL